MYESECLDRVITSVTRGHRRALERLGGGLLVGVDEQGSPNELRHRMTREEALTDLRHPAKLAGEREHERSTCEEHRSGLDTLGVARPGGQLRRLDRVGGTSLRRDAHECCGNLRVAHDVVARDQRLPPQLVELVRASGRSVDQRKPVEELLRGELAVRRRAHDVVIDVVEARDCGQCRAADCSERSRHLLQDEVGGSHGPVLALQSDQGRPPGRITCGIGLRDRASMTPLVGMHLDELLVVERKIRSIEVLQLAGHQASCQRQVRPLPTAQYEMGVARQCSDQLTDQAESGAGVGDEMEVVEHHTHLRRRLCGEPVGEVGRRHHRAGLDRISDRGRQSCSEHLCVTVGDIALQPSIDALGIIGVLADHAREERGLAVSCRRGHHHQWHVEPTKQASMEPLTANPTRVGDRWCMSESARHRQRT